MNAWLLPKLTPKVRIPKLVHLATPVNVKPYLGSSEFVKKKSGK